MQLIYTILFKLVGTFLYMGTTLQNGLYSKVMPLGIANFMPQCRGTPGPRSGSRWVGKQGGVGGGYGGLSG